MRILFVLLFLFIAGFTKGQRVGLVLSGGGSGGAAHVGVLKALEQHKIPLDYITGTSMGALVGGLYAMGYTPSQIEKIIVSEEFKKMVEGEIDEKYIYYFREKEPNAHWIGLKFRLDSTFRYRFPTNLVSPVNMDYALMEYTAPASAAAGYDFDSLFIPFRCVAADIYNKKEVVFRNGDLGRALRSTTTYPFYFKPISIDNKLLFDGGLYNNFPADVMYQTFLPDVIIGSTVVNEIAPPGEDDIYSQIKNMIMERTSYGEVCEKENMLIIHPVIPKTGILNFSYSAEMIIAGYSATISRMDEIKRMIPRIQDSVELEKRRNLFFQKVKPLRISEISIHGLTKNQIGYFNGIIGRKKMPLESAALKPYYYRLALDERILKIYPISELIPGSNDYKLKLEVKVDRDLYAQFGGLFSSRPINTGFVSLRYSRLGKIGVTADGNAYFGKFYSSAQLKTALDFPVAFPFVLEGDFTLNNLNYFKSASTFFEDVKPSYLIHFERSLNGGIAIPSGNHSRIRTGHSIAWISDDYYQTKQFLSVDTADRTNFNHQSTWAQFEFFTQNKIIYANQGLNLGVKIRYFMGEEENIPGSTSTFSEIFRKRHNFFRLKVYYDQYFRGVGPFKFGVFGEALISDQPFFNNYTATALAAPAFNVIPESKTMFLNNFRAFNYAAGGLKFITSFTKRLDLRIEGYLFQPYQQIYRKEDESSSLGQPFQKRLMMASAVLTYDTPVAPIALSFNYYQDAEKPFSFLFTLGYLIFNKGALD